MKYLVLAVVFSSLGLLAAVPGVYQGADAVLDQVAAQVKATLASTNPNADNVAKLQNDLATFSKTNSTLAPEDAAAQWIALADRLGNLSQDQLRENYQSDNPEGGRLSYQTVIAALPPPAAWDALAVAVEKRPVSNDAPGLRTIYLRLTAHTLTNNHDGITNDLIALGLLKSQIKGRSREALTQITASLKQRLQQNSDDGNAVLAELERQLSILQNQPPDERSPRFQIPDLVSLIGEQPAETFLRKVFTQPVEIAIEEGDETRKLARKVALAMIKQISVPQWSLTASIDATQLYEALIEKFPSKSPDDDDSNGDEPENARIYYLLGLLAAHRSDDAVAFALKQGNKLGEYLPSEGIDALERAGLTRELVSFFNQVLSQNPDLPFWSSYVELSAKMGETNKMVALAESSAARKDLPAKQQANIQKILRDAYLAADQIEQALALFRQHISTAASQPPVQSGDGRSPQVDDTGLDLAELGAVLGRDELIEEGINAERAAIKSCVGANAATARRGSLERLAAFFIELNRGSEAETTLSEALALADKSSGADQQRQSLIRLLDLYHQAEHPADVLALLDHAPQWNAMDLAEIFEESTTTNRNQNYAGYVAARALSSLNRPAEARKINDALLDAMSGYDPAYKLLLELEPDTALARLDALYARDQFEERPLIWKAKLLFDQGKFEEAEAVAKKAIAIDPSDGEQGPGRRMRVYGVLADIREARGDSKEAAFLRGAVTAIRHSEEADRFYSAGLISRAVKMYQEALTHFSDAYCIQSRLALRMADLGDFAGAEEHYRRAYELMPESFGRVESHCFGCERAFAGERAQSIAEKVFTQIAAKTPEKPQVHYLLGYLRYEQERIAEALPEFREAVRLDPDYLNAWKKLAEISKKAHLPAADRDAILLNILRLDPLQRHSSSEAGNVTNLRAAWTALEAAARLKTARPDTLYPLAASAAALEAVAKSPGARNQGRHYRSYRSKESSKPGEVIANNSLLQELSSTYSYTSYIFSE